MSYAGISKNQAVFSKFRKEKGHHHKIFILHNYRRRRRRRRRHHHHHHHHHHISVMELGHLLTRSGLTYPQVSSLVYILTFLSLKRRTIKFKMRIIGFVI